MAGKLSFSIAINLLTENFKRGTNQVKAAFRSMQMQFLTFAAALGAGGLGLSNFVSRLIEVSRETNRVTTALKNVSGSTAQYADNQRYLISIAKKYGLEINALTGNFAKFTAAASISGMAMGEQRKIFESVSRACTAFGMSADDSNGVFLALSQMMSKGKISSEELRLQMGERLPVAIQAMAKAAGVSVGQLDKLLKQGKLMSADVLPKFAQALDELIPNVDTDNLETSINKLKNTFTEFADSLDIQSKYKYMVDEATQMLSGLKGQVSGIVAFIVTLISGKLLGSVISYFSQFWKLIDVTKRKVETTETQKLLSVQKRIKAEKAYEAVLTDYNTIENEERLASKKQLDNAEKALNVAKLAEKKAILAAETAAENAAAVSSKSAWGKTLNTLKLGFIQFGRTLKGIWSSIGPMVLITLIATLISKLVSMREEAKRIKNIFSDYKKEAAQAPRGNDGEIDKLNRLYSIANNIKESLDVRKKALGEINGVLGESYRIDSKSLKINGDINDKIKDRIALLEQSAKAEFYAKKKVESFDKFNQLNAEYAKEVASWNGIQDRRGTESLKIKDGEKPMESTIPFSPLTKIYNLYLEREQYRKEYVHSSGEAAKSARYLLKNETSTTTTDPDDDKKKKTTLQKQQESYDKQFGELKAEFEIGAKTQAEYNKALGELNIKMYAEAKGTNDKKTLESEYYKIRKEAAEKAVRDRDKNAALVEFEKVQKEYNEKVSEVQTQQSKGLITQKELNENIASLSIEAAKSAAGIKGIKDEADIFIGVMQMNASLLTSKAKVKPRDTTYDYKKTKVEIASENLDKAKELADKLKEEYKGLGKTLSDEMANALANVPTLEEALKIAQVKEDIKNFSKELNESVYSGVKDIASSADRMVSAFENLKDVMNDVDASGWERIMAVWNAMTNVVDSFLSIIKMIENLTEITNKLSLAKETEARLTQKATEAKLVEGAVDTAVTGTKVVNAAIGEAADKGASQTKVTTAATNIVANTAEGASEAGASAASLPFPANIIAIGGAIAAAIALFATLPKFANGGIYTGGTPTGDNGLARLNKGEMILNMGQQSKLFRMLNSGTGPSKSQSVNIGIDRVKGTDLLLTINNTLKSQGKKPL